MGILFGDVQDLSDVFAIGVGVFAAGLGSDFINSTAIVFLLEKGTGGLIQDPVAVLVAVQVVVCEDGDGNLTVFGNAHDIPLLEDWARRFATVGAFQAIGMGKRVLMSGMKLRIQILGGTVFPALKLLLDDLSHPSGPQQLVCVSRLQCGS